MAEKVTTRDKVVNLLEQLEKGVKKVFSSEEYRSYLTFLSRFHQYSANNIHLIKAQFPTASMIKPFTAWQKDGRYVKKGEHGIEILRPVFDTIRAYAVDPEGNQMIDPETQKPKILRHQQIRSFTIAHVFDVSQTEGKPLPELAHELKDEVESYQVMMEAIKGASAYPIYIEAFERAAKGYCDYSEKKIVIQKGMSQAQTVKTAIHEVTHADLHVPEVLEGAVVNKRTREVEAESTAFVVCSHYGIDTADYSFPYLAAWSSDKTLKELQNSLSRIQKQANELISKIDTKLMELHQEQVAEGLPRDQPRFKLLSGLEENRLWLNQEKSLDQVNAALSELSKAGELTYSITYPLAGKEESFVETMRLEEKAGTLLEQLKMDCSRKLENAKMVSDHALIKKMTHAIEILLPLCSMHLMINQTASPEEYRELRKVVNQLSEREIKQLSEQGMDEIYQEVIIEKQVLEIGVK